VDVRLGRKKQEAEQKRAARGAGARFVVLLERCHARKVPDSQAGDNRDSHTG